MNNVLTGLLVAYISLLSSGCAFAQDLPASTSVEVLAYVHDPDGKPVSGATVRLNLPRYGPTEANYAPVEATVDVKGLAKLRGTAQQDYSLSARCSGYYTTESESRSVYLDQPTLEFVSGVQRFDLELRPVKNPVHSIGKFVDGVPIPSGAERIGFDLEMGDFVSPFGKGHVPDLVFAFERRVLSEGNESFKATLTFSNPLDGIVLMRQPRNVGSEFKYPYSAPTQGYAANREWAIGHRGPSSYALNADDVQYFYIVRIRSRADEKGNLKYALYGVIDGDIGFDKASNGSGRGGYVVGFNYFLNPDWTRNLEFGRHLEELAGTGKLLVAPPPAN